MDINQFDWNGFYLPYELAIKGFILKFEAIKKEYIAKGLTSPIEIVTGRVKSPESIIDKANRIGVSLDHIEDVYDIAGVRITCKYIQDVYDVLEMIKARKDIQVVQVRDYIENPKPSGYRSLHIIGKCNVETLEGQIQVNIEFQIRTHAMHLWASIEHGLKYKYDRNIPDSIKDRLVNASMIAYNLDMEMGNIKDEILKSNVKSKMEIDETEISIVQTRRW